MIRFQICIFDILNTADMRESILAAGVVIRFQICIFDILNTALNNQQPNNEGCDSLSNLYL